MTARNSAGIIAAQNFSAGLHGTLTNSANRWFALTTPDERLRDFQPMREWLDIASRRLLLSFAPANSPFYSAAAQLFGDVSVFGNAAQYDEQPPGETGFLDVTLSMAECCYDIDAYGRVTEVIRKFRLTPTAAAQRYGYDPLPEKLRELADKGSRDRVTFRETLILDQGRSGQPHPQEPGGVAADGFPNPLTWSRFSCHGQAFRQPGPLRSGDPHPPSGDGGPVPRPVHLRRRGLGPRLHGLVGWRWSSDCDRWQGIRWQCHRVKEDREARGHA